MQPSARLRILALGVLAGVFGFLAATFGFGFAVDAVVFWPMMLVGWLFSDFAAYPNIGTSDAPVYEATPVHFVLGLVGFGACILYWYGALSLLVLYHLWPWLHSERSKV